MFMRNGTTHDYEVGSGTEGMVGQYDTAAAGCTTVPSPMICHSAIATWYTSPPPPPGAPPTVHTPQFFTGSDLALSAICGMEGSECLILMVVGRLRCQDNLLYL